jgi:hypothetical protein
MFEFAGELQPLVDTVFLVAMAIIAFNGIRYRDENGNTDFVRLLFGCIAATFFFLVLFQDVLGVVRFS